jgi:hypothetical protein
MQRCSALALAAVLFMAPRAAIAAPSVWIIDDGEKIKQGATSTPFERGEDNPVWKPGEPVRLFALENETIAIQVVVEAGDDALDAVTVDLDALDGPDDARIANDAGARDPTRFVGRPIERFVEHFVHVDRPSRNAKEPRESLGWAAGSGPAPGDWIGDVPDALIPIEIAPTWAPYPLHIAPLTNGIVWIDVTIPKRQPPGTYHGTIAVRSGDTSLASIPLDLEIADVVLPDRIVKTMVFYDRRELDRRMGDGAAAEDHLWRLLHRHRIAALHAAMSVADVDRQARALDGSAFTKEHDYEGPAESIGDGVIAIGAYGSLGAPSSVALAKVEAIADRLDALGVLGTTDAFVYAVDEECESPFGESWKRLLASSSNANAKRVKVAWTCSDEPDEQPVDVPIVTGALDANALGAARARGKEIWLYNGVLPHEGTFLTDAPAVSPRANGWLLGMFDVGRWFYWESTFWYDDNRGGRGAYDPFVTAETFHNDHGDACIGDGVLLYPGKQTDMFEERSLGMDGVVASIRLKSWRRGIEDAGYLELARAADAAKADAIARALIPSAFGDVRAGARASFPERGSAYVDARRALLDLVPRGQDGGGAVKPVGPAPAPRARACGCPRGCGVAETRPGVLVPFATVGALIVVARWRFRATRSRRGDARSPRAPSRAAPK